MKPTTNVVVGACVLSLLTACASRSALDAGRRDGLPSWAHAPNLGIVYTFASYGNTERGARDLVTSDALKVASPATLLSFDSTDVWQPGPDFGFTLSYDITRFFTVEANYFDNGGGGGGDFQVDGATVFLNGTATQNGVVHSFKSGTDVATQMYGAALLGYWPVWQGLHVMARAGFEHTKTNVANYFATGLLGCTTTDQAGRQVSTFCSPQHHASAYSAARNVPQFGAGFAYRWDGVTATVEYERTGNVGNTQTGRYSVNALSLELSCAVTALWGR